MPGVLQVRLLGELELRLDGVPLGPLESARAASLLAYLLIHRDAPQSRQHLAFLLWPDSTEAQARTNLRHVLHDLRRALPDADRFVDARSRTLQWRPDAPFRLDLTAFEDALARAERDDTGPTGALREAVETYRGDLLEGSYDEWLDDQRARLRHRYLAALERLAALLESRGDLADAVGYAERLLRHDPLREGTYRLLMRLHAARGDRARALHVYHVCTATLERELGVEPSVATREDYEVLVSGRVEGDDATGAGPRAPGGWPLVGRAAEWARLTTAWRESERGRAQLVLVAGEPGAGKTRLLDELRAWCAHRGAATAVARSYPVEGALAYAPVAAWLRSEAFAGRLTRLEPSRLGELTRLLPELMAMVPGLAPPEPRPESDQRQRLFDAAAHAVLGLGLPVLLVADDLQWCDRETLQFLHYLLRVRPDARLLVAATARREEIDPSHALNELMTGLRARERCVELEVGPLAPGETATLAERICGRRLAGADAKALHDETGGNPLFIGEALRAGWRGGGATGQWLTPKVRAVIDARLAQLSAPARDLAGMAAAVGRECSAGVLAHAAGTDEATFVRALDELWRRGILRERGATSYDFSHDKIRETAYLSLGPAVRTHHHRRIAEALARVHAADVEPVAAQLAAHYDRAGSHDDAVPWYERAAEVALQVHANAEAVRLLTRALELLRTLPDTTRRKERELEVVSALLAPLAGIEGYAGERLTGEQRRALEIARDLGVEPAPPLLRSLAIVSLSRGDFAAAQRFGEQLERQGERAADAVLMVESAYVLGIAAFWRGELAEARRRFEAAVARYQPGLARTHALRYGLDPRAVCLSRLANTLWLLGDSGAAVSARERALTLSRELGHPYTRAVTLVFAAVLALDMRDEARVREFAAALARECADQDVRHVRLVVDAFAGYVEILDGRVADGLARLHRVQDDGDDSAPGMGAALVRVLLEGCAVAGDARAGLAAADRALAAGGAVRVWEAEVRRLRAGFLTALGAPAAEAESERARALAVAREQGARAFAERLTG